MASTVQYRYSSMTFRLSPWASSSGSYRSSVGHGSGCGPTPTLGTCSSYGASPGGIAPSPLRELTAANGTLSVVPLLTTLALIPLLLPSWLDPAVIIEALGPWALWGVAFIIFAECGLFSILPGDSLLFTIGMFTALGTFSFGGKLSTLLVVFAVLIVAAILGNVVGYWIGYVIGPPLFKPRTSWIGRKLFNPVYVTKTHTFFEKYGPRALILARFVPLVRTFVTLIAGVGKMSFRKFIAYTAIGGVLWVVGVTLMGYFLGQIPFINKNIDAVLVLIVLVSMIPMGVEYLNHRREAKALAAVAASEVDPA